MSYDEQQKADKADEEELALEKEVCLPSVHSFRVVFFGEFCVFL